MNRRDWLWRSTNEATESRRRMEEEAKTAHLADATVQLGREHVVAAVLREHWLTGVECDHEARTDVATCYCSTWRSAPQPSHGEAVEAWVQHVLAALRAAPATTEAGDAEDARYEARRGKPGPSPFRTPSTPVASPPPPGALREDDATRTDVPRRFVVCVTHGRTWGLFVRNSDWVCEECGRLAHSPACNGDNESCRCGLRWRIEARTNWSLYQAWRKRAEEAEAAPETAGEGAPDDTKEGRNG